MEECHALQREINELFRPFYPYLAEQLLEEYGKEEGHALEVGPYGPGISIEMARRRPSMTFTVGDSDPDVNEYLLQEIARAGMAERVQVIAADKYGLPWGESSLDLIFLRGGLFFWERHKEILREFFRVLRSGGLAALGGGFGAATPEALIEERLKASRTMNRRLGKRTLSISDVNELIGEASLEGVARIDERHGLWVYLRKP